MGTLRSFETQPLYRPGDLSCQLGKFSHVDDGVESAFFSCVRVCVCVHIHTYIHSHVHIYIYLYIYICACVGGCVAYVACAHPHTRCTLFERGFMMSRVQCCLWLST